MNKEEKFKLTGSLDENVTRISTIHIDPYPKGWKLFQMGIFNKPKNITQTLRLIWGFDLFLYKIPFLKTTLLLNILVWILIFLTK